MKEQNSKIQELEQGGKELEGRTAQVRELEARLAAEGRNGKSMREELKREQGVRITQEASISSLK